MGSRGSTSTADGVTTRRLTRALSRETIRHTVASVLSGVLATAVVGAGVGAGVFGQGIVLNALLLIALFGLYGPLFLLMTWLTFRRFEGARLRAVLQTSADRNRLLRWLLLTSPPSWAATVLVVGVVSVAVVTSGADRSLWVIPICVVGVAGSWLLMVGVMAVEYMRTWANEDSMAFPTGDERSVVDFVYLSMQLSTSFSSADVAFTQRGVRGLASLHSVLAFAYSTAIIAVFASLLITVAR